MSRFRRTLNAISTQVYEKKYSYRCLDTMKTIVSNKTDQNYIVITAMYWLFGHVLAVTSRFNQYIEVIHIVNTDISVTVLFLLHTLIVIYFTSKTTETY